MIERIRLKYQKNMVWLYPLKYILIMCLLSFIVILIDSKFTFIHNYIPNFLMTNKSLAQTILSALVSAIITIMTFTFSTTMVVLTMYSSQFSPRVVQNFLSEKMTLKVLGIFMGGFVYFITSLLFIKDVEGSKSFISATVGVIYAIVCLAYFALFIFKVSSSIQANNLIGNLYDGAKNSIKRAVELHHSYSFKCENYSEIGKSKKNSYIVKSDRNGYIQSIDYAGILNSISDKDSIVKIEIKNGEFVVLGQPLAKVYMDELLEEDNEKEITKMINGYTVIENTRNVTYDYMYAIEKIVDITLRAISPGINDPNTAIQCINILGVLLSMMSEESTNVCKRKSEEYNGEIIYPYFNFKEDIYNTFYQIVIYGGEDISVVMAVLKALKNITYYAKGENLEAVEVIKKYGYDKTFDNFKNEMDREKIKSFM